MSDGGDGAQTGEQEASSAELAPSPPPAEPAEVGPARELEVAVKNGAPQERGPCQGLLGALEDQLAGVRGEIAELSRRFALRLQNDDVKDRQLDRLHEEVQGHRHDLLARATDVLVRGILRVRDGVATKVARGVDGVSVEQVVRDLAYVVEDLDLLLDNHGVVAFREPGDRYVPARQQILSVLSDPPDEQYVHAVAQRVAPGFERSGVIVRKEQVRVWGSLRRPPPAPTPQPASTEPKETP